MIYTVRYAGGRGDKVWDAEIEIEADGIREALYKAESVIGHERQQHPAQRGDAAIIAIEEEGVNHAPTNRTL